MEAMIFAAGEGTRLRPLTDGTPKALVSVRGRPLLGHVMDRLVAAGATRIVVNTCRHAEQVAAWVGGHTPPGVEVLLAHEPHGPYETGGGLLAAAPLFRGDGPILLHNVDVLSRIPLDLMLAAHRAGREGAADGRLLATLGVQDRGAERVLLFDDDGLLGRETRGRDGGVRDSERVREGVGVERRWSFAGIHVVEPAIFELCERTGTFSIRTLYLDLARQGHRIQPLDVSAYEWFEVGTPGRLAEAEARLG